MPEPVPAPATQEISIQFDDLGPAEAGEKAALLREAQLDAAPGLSAEVRRGDGETMDLGATLILVLGTPAVIAVATQIAKGIGAFIARERPGRIRIRKGDTVIEVDGASSDMAKVAESLAKMV